MIYRKPNCPHCGASFHVWQARDEKSSEPNEPRHQPLFTRRAKHCPHCGGPIALEARSGVRVLLCMAVGLVVALLVPVWFGAVALVVASVLGLTGLKYTTIGKERS